MNNYSENSLAIRPAVAEDGEKLAEFARKSFFDAFSSDNSAENLSAYMDEAFAPEQVIRELKDPNNHFLLAEISGTLAGYVKLNKSDVPDCVSPINAVELERIYADQKFHGAGVGSALMNSAIEYAIAGQFDGVWLGVWEQNPRAIAFYRKYEFEPVGEKSFQMGAELQTDQIFLRRFQAMAR